MIESCIFAYVDSDWMWILLTHSLPFPKVGITRFRFDIWQYPKSSCFRNDRKLYLCLFWLSLDLDSLTHSKNLFVTGSRYIRLVSICMIKVLAAVVVFGQLVWLLGYCLTCDACFFVATLSGWCRGSLSAGFVLVELGVWPAYCWFLSFSHYQHLLVCFCLEQ